MKENHSKDKKKRYRRKSKKKIILISVLSIIAVLFIVLAGGYYYIRSRIYLDYTPSTISNSDEQDKVNYTEVDGITNVLLVGTDGRTLDEPARSDSIIIATLDNNNKNVKLTTIMRDTLVSIPGHGEDKINAAFAYGSAALDSNGKELGAKGGISLLINTIKKNFNIRLDKYAIVNFWGFESIIDQIGGIDVNIKDYEVDEVNKYIGESTGNHSSPITKTGLQHVNGQQALSYARIRYVGNGNFERGERQATVLSQIADKIKEVSPLKYLGLANTLVKQIKTNVDIPEALNLAYTISKMQDINPKRLQIPQNELIARDDLYRDKGWSLLIDLKQNSTVLNDFIFKNKEPNKEEFDLDKVSELTAKYKLEMHQYHLQYGGDESAIGDVWTGSTDKKGNDR